MFKDNKLKKSGVKSSLGKRLWRQLQDEYGELPGNTFFKLQLIECSTKFNTMYAVKRGDFTSAFAQDESKPNMHLHCHLDEELILMFNKMEDKSLLPSLFVASHIKPKCTLSVTQAGAASLLLDSKSKNMVELKTEHIDAGSLDGISSANMFLITCSKVCSTPFAIAKLDSRNDNSVTLHVYSILGDELWQAAGSIPLDMNFSLHSIEETKRCFVCSSHKDLCCCQICKHRVCVLCVKKKAMSGKYRYDGKKETDDEVKNVEEGEEEEDHEPTEEEMDYALEFAFTFACKDSKISDFPKEASLFLSQNMQSHNPERFRLEFKKSSYANMGCFLKAMSKLGIIRTKTIKQKLMVHGVDHDHEYLGAFEITPEMLELLKKRNKERAKAAINSDHIPIVLAVAEMFSLSNTIKWPIEFENKLIVKKSDLKQYISSYIDHNELAQGEERKIVTLDLFLKQIARTQEETMDWGTFLQEVIKNCKRKYYVVSNKMQELDVKTLTSTDDIPYIDIKLDGKKSKLSGLYKFNVDINSFHQLYRQAGLHGDLDKEKGYDIMKFIVKNGKNKNNALEIKRILHKSFGVPEKYIRTST